MAARCYTQRKGSGWVTDRAHEISETARLARRAGELGKDDAVALSTAGMALAYVVEELDEGVALIDRALLLNPNLAWGWLFSGWVRVWLGEPEAAIEHVARAMRLSPHDPHMFLMRTAAGSAHFFAGRYGEALSLVEAALREQPDHLGVICMTAACAALAGRLAQAQKAMVHLRELDPALRIANLAKLFPLRRSSDIVKWSEGLRIAGLPE
jgi:tetratricopeptide (TPR) repeat protein